MPNYEPHPHPYTECPELNRRSPYYGPCRAGLHPEFGWGKPCMSDATEYVSVSITAGDFAGESLMRLCAAHATAAEQLPGFQSRKPLEPPALTYERPAVQP